MLRSVCVASFLFAELLLGYQSVGLAVDPKPTAKAVDVAAVKEAEEALKTKGLRRQGLALVLIDEAQLSKMLADQRKLKREVVKAAAALGEVLTVEQHALHLLNQYRLERRQLNAEVNNVKNVERHNRMVTMINELSDRIEQMQEDKTLEGQLTAARQEYSTARERYIEHVLGARKLADKLKHAWADLEQDADAKALVEDLNQASGKKFVVAESKNLQTMIKSLQKLEESVLSESIELRKDSGNTFLVDVTFNGKHTKEMCLDSGASIVALPHHVAESMNLAPGESAETVILVLADGRQVPAKKISIASVRVGKFTVENVEGAVLPPQLSEAPPLLGMSFLGNFKFDIDPSAKKLTMTRIEGGDVPTPKKEASEKSGAKSRKRDADVPDIVE